MSFIRRRFTYANVAMTLALVFAMTGGAYAAKHYLITSTKQISPKVLKQLAGKRGPAGKDGAAGPQGPAGANGKDGATGPQGPAGKDGATGPQGPAGKDGATGPQGPQGEPWTAGGTLPSGKTETGVFSATGEVGGGALHLAASFNIPLKVAPEDVRVVDTEGKEIPSGTPAACTGTAEAPTAAPGHVCFYEARTGPQSFLEPGEGFALYTSGVTILAYHLGPNGEPLEGTWAVTAK